MKIYKLDFDVNKFKSIQLCEKVDADFYQMFDGRSLSNSWIVPRVKVYDDDLELEDGDAPGFNIPVLNKRAYEVLYPMISNDIEVLIIQLNDEILYGINVLTIIDAINYDLSKYKTYRDGKRIMFFEKYEFIEEAIKGKNIFKISDLPRGDVFVSEKFAETIIENQLKGFKLELVYG